MSDRQLLARQTIEAEFREAVERDVELLAEQACFERGLGERALHCRHSNEIISDLLWSRFGAFDWEGVAYVYDGTYGQASRYLWAKVELTLAWVRAGGASPEVEGALQDAAGKLRCLWVEWAGWKATTTDELALALAEFEESADD